MTVAKCDRTEPAQRAGSLRTNFQREESGVSALPQYFQQHRKDLSDRNLHGKHRDEGKQRNDHQL